MSDFRLTLRPEPPGPDRLGRLPVYRLRIALKRLLRDTGLRAVRYEELAEPAAGQGPQEASDGRRINGPAQSMDTAQPPSCRPGGMLRPAIGEGRRR